MFVLMGRLSPFTFAHPGFNLSKPARRYHCFYAPPARPAANLNKPGLWLIYEKIANIPNCRCLSSRCGAARQNARSIYFHSDTRLKYSEIFTQQICQPDKKTSQELRMLSTVTLNCHVTKIVMNSGSQL